MSDIAPKLRELLAKHDNLYFCLTREGLQIRLLVRNTSHYQTISWKDLEDGVSGLELIDFCIRHLKKQVKENL